METVVSSIFAVIGLYLLVGLLFGIAFVTKGVTRIDPTAKDGASWGFRLAILPATAALWPLMAKRWASGTGTPPEECSPHRCAACKGCSKGEDV